MSTLVFPTLPGMDIAIKRTPVYATKIQTASSGKELRASFQSTPRYRYALPLNFLRQAVLNASNDEAAQLLAFFGAHKGRWDSFWLPDAMAINLIGNGDCSNHTALTSTPEGAGLIAWGYTNPLLSPTGWVRVVMGNGAWTLIIVADSIPAAPGDTFYARCRSARNDSVGSQYLQINYLNSVGSVISWSASNVITAIGLDNPSPTILEVTGTAPAGTVAIQIICGNNGGTSGVAAFFGQLFACRMPAAGLIAAPDGALTRVNDTPLEFERRVRFDTDELEFDRFLAQVWEAKSLPFISVK